MNILKFIKNFCQTTYRLKGNIDVLNYKIENLNLQIHTSGILDDRPKDYVFTKIEGIFKINREIQDIAKSRSDYKLSIGKISSSQIEINLMVNEMTINLSRENKKDYISFLYSNQHLNTYEVFKLIIIQENLESEVYRLLEKIRANQDLN